MLSEEIEDALRAAEADGGLSLLEVAERAATGEDNNNPATEAEVDVVLETKGELYRALRERAERIADELRFNPEFVYVELVREFKREHCDGYRDREQAQLAAIPDML